MPHASGRVRRQTFKEALAEALQHPSYWLLTAGFFVCGFHVAFIMVHLPAFTVDQGLPSWVGPSALSVVGIANIVGTFIAGQSGRFIEKRRGLSLIYFGRAVLFLGFLFLPITPLTGDRSLRLCSACSGSPPFRLPAASSPPSSAPPGCRCCSASSSCRTRSARSSACGLAGRLLRHDALL